MLISCFYSLEPAGHVKGVTLDTWLAHRSASSNLRNRLQQSLTVYWLLLILPTPKGWNPESSMSVTGIEPGPPAHMSEHESERLTTYTN